ncbi:hypothetical protein JCM6882_003525 [Rhodosporidiobolus microsporus]
MQSVHAPMMEKEPSAGGKSDSSMASLEDDRITDALALLESLSTLSVNDANLLLRKGIMDLLDQKAFVEQLFLLQQQELKLKDQLVARIAAERDQWKAKAKETHAALKKAQEENAKKSEEES